MKFRRVLTLALGLTVAVSSALGGAAPALAKSSRAAQVKEVVGDVQVTKAGGSKSYRVFVGMTLNQGDHLKTGDGAKVVLEITDHEDEITVDENASLYISELQEENGGKKSKLKMWAGSLWSKVKTLTGTEDEYEVETPTAVMGVRGTNLYVGVDPESGQMTFMIGSGVGEVSKTGEGASGETVFVYPMQQLNLSTDDQEQLDSNFVTPVDLDQFVQNAGPSVIEALIKNKAALDQENAEFIEKQKKLLEQGQTDAQTKQLGITNQADLARVSTNLDNLVGNIVKKAIEQNKVDETKINEVINQVNTSLEKKIDLTKVKEISLTAEQQKQLDERKKQDEARKQQLEAQKKEQERIKKALEEQMKKLAEMLKKQEEARKKAEEEAKQKALELLQRTLTEAEKAALNQRVEEKKAVIETQNKQAESNKTPVNNPTPVTGNNPTPTPPPVLKKAEFKAVNVAKDTANNRVTFEIQVDVENVGSVYGAQVHLVTPGEKFAGRFEMNPSLITHKEWFDSHYDSLNGTIFDKTKSAYDYKIESVTVNGASAYEFVYAVANLPSETAKTVTTKEKLISIPMSYIYGDTAYAPGTTVQVKVAKILLVDASGTKIVLEPISDTITITLP